MNNDKFNLIMKYVFENPGLGFLIFIITIAVVVLSLVDMNHDSKIRQMELFVNNPDKVAQYYCFNNGGLWIDNVCQFKK